eukprot:COSAG05_NODE_1307_length_5228_cov_23.380386_8_plen_49_part_01
MSDQEAGQGDRSAARVRQLHGFIGTSLSLSARTEPMIEPMWPPRATADG